MNSLNYELVEDKLLEFLNRYQAKNGLTSVLPYVTLFWSHNSGARGLKIGMHNPYMDGSKVTNKIFDKLIPAGHGFPSSIPTNPHF